MLYLSKIEWDYRYAPYDDEDDEFDDNDDEMRQYLLRSSIDIFKTAIKTHGSIDVIKTFPQRALDKIAAHKAEREFAKLHAPELIETVNKALVAKGYSALQVMIRPPKDGSTKPPLRWTNKRAKYAFEYVKLKSESLLEALSIFVFQRQIGHFFTLSSIIKSNFHFDNAIFDTIVKIPNLRKPTCRINMTCRLLAELRDSKPKFFGRILTDEEWVHQVEMIFDPICLKAAADTEYAAYVAVVWSYTGPPRFYSFFKHVTQSEIISNVSYLESVVFMDIRGMQNCQYETRIHAIMWQ